MKRGLRERDSEQLHSPSVGECFRVLLLNRQAVMPGAISVILGFIAVFVTAPHCKIVLFIASGLALLSAVYRIWNLEPSRSLRLLSYLGNPDFDIDINQSYQYRESPLRLLLRVHVVNRSPVGATVKGVKLEIIENGKSYLFTYREEVPKEGRYWINTTDDSNHFIQPPCELIDFLQQLDHDPLEQGTHKAGDSSSISTA